MEFKKILVAINGSDLDFEMVKLACDLAKPHKGKVFVTYVIEIDRTMPLETENTTLVENAEKSLDKAEEIAEALDYEIITDLLQARLMGPAVVTEAAERGADLIIIGMGYQTPFGEFKVSDTAQYILKNSPIRVMVMREPMTVKVEG